MNIYEIADKILSEVTELTDLKENEDLDLVEEGLIESLAVIQVIVLIEQYIGIRIQPTNISKENISSLKKFNEYLHNLIQEFNK